MSDVDNDVVDIEVEAKQFGWVPQEDFKGNPDDWRDAETFVKRGKEINGFLRNDLEKIKAQSKAEKAAHEAELAEIRSTIAEFQKYHNETEARAYKRALEDLKTQKAEAIERGEGALVVDIDEQIATIKEAQTAKKEPEPAVEKPQGPAPAFLAWVKENLWYKTDPELQALANIIADEVGLENPGLKDEPFLEEITKRVKEAQPDKFSNPARRSASVSSSSDGRSPSTKTKKSYNDLPADAKAACDKFVKQKLMTQEQYVSEYEWD
jgi:hypothetical protein